MARSASRTAAARVRELRMGRGLTVERLATELRKAGIAWEPETVVEFEDGRRESLDVEELLALAVVLSVPPVALLANPSATTMAVAPRVEVPTAYGLLWMLGEQPLHGMTGAWTRDTLHVRLVRSFHSAMGKASRAHSMLETIERWQGDGLLDRTTAEGRRANQERHLLRALGELVSAISAMRRHAMSIPRLVDEELLSDLARLRGMTLGLDGQRQPARAKRLVPAQRP